MEKKQYLMVKPYISWKKPYISWKKTWFPADCPNARSIESLGCRRGAREGKRRAETEENCGGTIFDVQYITHER